MSPARSIDLNADLGEATDAEGIATERALLGLITTTHIACGGHAGDEESMTTTVAAALEHSVRIGAHPSYPDTAGFGRRPMDIDRGELGRSLCDQLSALSKVCEAAGTTIESVKAHGALYEEVAKGGAVVASDGSLLTLWVDTLCVHGDTPAAVAIATAVRRVMGEAGFEVTAPARA